MLGDRILDQAHASEKRHFVPAGGEVVQRQSPVLPAMGAHQLGHSFHVPRRPARPQDRPHEAVRPLVQVEVAAVIVAPLLVEPQLVVARESVGESGQIVRQQPRLLEPLLVLHQEAGHVPVRMGLGRDAEEPAPLGKGLVKDLRQHVHLPILGQIGVQRNVLAGQLAHAGRGGAGVVDHVAGQPGGRPARGVGLFLGPGHRSGRGPARAAPGSACVSAWPNSPASGGGPIPPAADLRYKWRNRFGKRGQAPFARNGPSGASHKRCLSPFPPIHSTLVLHDWQPSIVQVARPPACRAFGLLWRPWHCSWRRPAAAGRSAGRRSSSTRPWTASSPSRSSPISRRQTGIAVLPQVRHRIDQDRGPGQRHPRRAGPAAVRRVLEQRDPQHAAAGAARAAGGVPAAESPQSYPAAVPLAARHVARVRRPGPGAAGQHQAGARRRSGRDRSSTWPIPSGAAGSAWPSRCSAPPPPTPPACSPPGATTGPRSSSAS